MRSVIKTIPAPKSNEKIPRIVPSKPTLMILQAGRLRPLAPVGRRVAAGLIRQAECGDVHHQGAEHGNSAQSVQRFDARLLGDRRSARVAQ
jgi:hypothetical protein